MMLSQSFYALIIHLVSSLLVFHLTFAQFTSFMHPVCHDSERTALLQFKQNFIIDEYASSDPSAYPKVASWNSDKEDGNCCFWDGVKCNEDTGHVVKLDLASSLLYGSINSSSSLFHLVHLQWLSLADNHFNFSNIPFGIINLTRLTNLNLSESAFFGQIPSEILKLSKLVFLDLSYNYLELQNPSLADLVEQLINLDVLCLDKVEIYSLIPPALTNLSSLNFLSLSKCGIRGMLQYSIGNLRKLVYLDISFNLFDSELPPSIGNLKSLSYLDVTAASFSGQLPPSLGNLTQLNYLSIRMNNFFSLNSYSLSWLSNLKKLTLLDLSDNNLTGEIPFALMNLTQLNALLWYGNQLTGPIPSWLMNLNKLSYLFLNSNRLTGHIPIEIRNLTQLQYLRLAFNQLEGFIPSSIFEVKNLQRLDLFANNLSGIVDLNMFLLKLKRLEVLVLSLNKLSLLTKTIGTPILQKFIVIGFGSCNLIEFPYFLHNQDLLLSLDLSSNNIAGQVPRWFLNVSTYNLDYLNLSSNLLTGFELQNLVALPWVALKTLDIGYNKLQGPLPIPSVCQFYLVSNNHLRGEISPSICNLRKLYALDLSYNNLSGMLPECLGNFSDKLSTLKLQDNDFHGRIPQTFMNGTNLKLIDLSSNSLQGGLPKSLANCVKLKFLNLGKNQIIDIFPSSLGTLPQLEVLILKFNRFYGSISEPKASFGFPSLRIIDLSHNRFTGNLPSQYFQDWNAMKNISAKLTYLEDLLMPHDSYPVYTYYGYSDYSLKLSNKRIELEYWKLSNLIMAIILSNNEFVGEIPTSIANLKGLRNLNLSNNNIKGHIPSSLGNLTVLESLDLSNNKLSGEIPQQLGELTTLAAFDVSHNHLTGQIPRGKQFNTFANDSFDGNPGLCGEPLSKKCKNLETSQEENPHSESLFAFSWKIVLIGYASGTIIGVVLGHIFGTRKEAWLGKTFRLRSKTIQRKRRPTN